MEPTAFIYLLSALVVLLLVIDCQQTLRIKDHPNYFEINPILGKHPSDTEILIYFAVCIVLFLAVTLYALPKWAGDMAAAVQVAWCAPWLAVEVWCVRNNYKFGLGL